MLSPSALRAPSWPRRFEFEWWQRRLRPPPSSLLASDAALGSAGGKDAGLVGEICMDGPSFRHLLWALTVVVALMVVGRGEDGGGEGEGGDRGR